MSGTNNASSAGSNVGQKVKGAFQAVHGIGESLRGNAMDFVDSATGTAQTGHGAAVKGDQEMETGMANMENRAAPVGAAPNGVAPGAGVGTGAGAAAATNATGATGPGVTGGSTGTYPPGSSTGY